jgi:hypothetical protein
MYPTMRESDESDVIHCCALVLHGAPRVEARTSPRTSLQLAHLFNHFVGSGKQRWRHHNAKLLSRGRVDDELKARGLLHR